MKISNVQSRRGKWVSNYFTLAKLGELEVLKPQLVNEITTRVFASMNYRKPLLYQTLSSIGTKWVTSNEVEWKLTGATEMPDTIVQATKKDEIVAGRPFKLRMSKDMWLYGDEISPGDSTHMFQCRIVKDPYREGNHFVYEVELSHADTIPDEFLQAGAQWGKLFSAYGEAAVQGGSTQYSGSFAMRNHIGKLRKQYRISDYAWEEVMAVRVTDSEGNTYDMIDDYALFEYRKQWLEEIEKALLWSRTTDTELDSTGNKVDKFPGLIQQVTDWGNDLPTSNITLRKIEDFVDGIIYNKYSPEETVVLEFYTGRKGMEHFSRLIEGGIGSPNGWVLQNDSNFKPVQSASSPYHKNAYSYGYQFIEYRMPNNVILRPKVLPMLDDTNNQFELVNGFPKSSMTMLFLDFSPVGREASNIQIMKKKNGEKVWYVDGGISHTGPQMGGSAAHGGEWYEKHNSLELGLLITDPSRTGIIHLI
ncbi:MAG: hypothetical protein IIU44_06640 [Spirochaetales bacterium]|nr:hypothetical protein [Spirochaetales bacterium]